MANNETAPAERADENSEHTHSDVIAELETDCGGWSYYDGGIWAIWLDDPDGPVYGVGVNATSKSVPPEGIEHPHKTLYRHVPGYQVHHGPTRTDGATETTLETWWTTPETTPREAGEELYPIALKRAREWMCENPPKRFQPAGVTAKYGPVYGRLVAQSSLEAQNG